jgi:hypothetical protein
VDDGLLCCTKKETLENFIMSLKSTFEITCNDPSYYVGMEITRDREKRIINVNQKGYISRVLQRFGLSDCKPLTCPLDPTLKLAVDMDFNYEDGERFPYREAIGCLNYISMISRPDITFAVNSLARYCEKPTSTHWSCVKRVMKYLKGTSDYKLTFGGEPVSCLSVTGYCDSDWAGEVSTRKSTTGYVFTLNGGPIAWTSRLQQLTSLSVAEAEYVALSETLKECLWLRPFLMSLGVKPNGPTPINVDNQAAIALSKNPEFHKRTKYIGVRYHRVREEQDAGNVVIQYVPTESNPADMLTKSLGGTLLERNLKLMNVK